jgi:hypothetical protein
MPAPDPDSGPSQPAAEVLPVVKDTVAAIFNRVTTGATETDVAPEVARGTTTSANGKGGVISEGFAALQNLGGNAAAMFASATGSGSPAPAETDPR